MSKVIKIAEGFVGLAHVVETDDSKQYVVSSVSTPHALYPYETMVFKWNRKTDTVSNWMDLVCRKYSNAVAMHAEHENMTINLETYLEKAGGRKTHERKYSSRAMSVL